MQSAQHTVGGEQHPGLHPPGANSTLSSGATTKKMSPDIAVHFLGVETAPTWEPLLYITIKGWELWLQKLFFAAYRLRMKHTESR